MKNLRLLAVASLALAPMIAAPAQAGTATRSVDLGGSVITVSDVPPPPTVDTCDAALSTRRVVCTEQITDEYGNPQLRVCFFDDALSYVLPWYSGSSLACIRTAQWAYVPVMGACVATLTSDPAACVNANPPGGAGRACILWVPGFEVCEDSG